MRSMGKKATSVLATAVVAGSLALAAPQSAEAASCRMTQASTGYKVGKVSLGLKVQVFTYPGRKDPSTIYVILNAKTSSGTKQVRGTLYTHVNGHPWTNADPVDNTATTRSSQMDFTASRRSKPYQGQKVRAVFNYAGRSYTSPWVTIGAGGHGCGN